MARVPLVLLGCVLALLLTEALLQAGALVLRLTRDDPAASARTGARRILCLGDSNTYGIRLEHRSRDAYPAQLESLWNEAHPQRPVEVFNAGVPGTSSSQVLRNLPAMIDAFEPDWLIVMVGVNDYWSAPVPTDPETEEEWGAFLRRHSRLVRLVLLLRRRFDRAELEVGMLEGEGTDAGAGFVRFGDREFSLGRRPDAGLQEAKAGPGRTERRAFEAGVGRALAENLGGVLAVARSRDVELVLMTYPSSSRAYGAANAALRAAAAGIGARLLDLEQRFRPLCRAPGCPEWLYPDQHPRAAGYRVVAESLVAVLEGAAR